MVYMDFGARRHSSLVILGNIHIHHPKSIYTNALNNQYISIVVYNGAKLLTYAFDHELTE